MRSTPGSENSPWRSAEHREEWMRRVIDPMPPLTPEQVARINRLLFAIEPPAIDDEKGSE